VLAAALLFAKTTRLHCDPSAWNPHVMLLVRSGMHAQCAKPGGRPHGEHRIID
jgi:hypothetical protein